MTGIDIVLWWTLKGSAILGVALLATRLLRRRPAAIRHAVWTIAVAAQLAIPLAQHLVPQNRLAVAIPHEELVRPLAGGTAAAKLTGTTERSSPGTDRSPLPVHRPRPTVDERTGFAVLLAGAAFLLCRLVLGGVRIARIAGRAEPIADPAWLSLERELGRALGIAQPVALSRSADIRIPMTWGLRRPRILLPHDSQNWDAACRRHVLLHELGHVRRADTLWQLVAQGALVVFWFNPLLWLAIRRMRMEAEHACDDYVLRDGERPSRYAATLVELGAASIGAPAFPVLSLGRRSELETRVSAILSPVRDLAVRRRFGAAVAGVVLTMTLPLAAIHRAGGTSAGVASQAGCRPLMIPNGHFLETSGTLTLAGETLHYFFLRPEPDRWLEASFSRDARFTPDDRGIVATPNLHALVREKRGGVDRAVYLDEVAGALQHRYRVDGRGVDWDGASERWLEGVLPDVIRRTSADVADRARRIVESEGTDAAIEEASRIAVPDVRRQYLVALLELRTAAELPRDRLIAAARQDDEPSFAAFLADLVAREGDHDGLRRQVLDEIRHLRHGSSRLLVLQAMLEHPERRVQMAALQAIDLVAEDVWRRDLLQASAPRALGGGPELAEAWFTALETLRSPLYRRELKDWIQSQVLPPPRAARAAASLS
jgi:beta-lactamase regulating signal transducer with metallopeptidase domain